MIIPEWLFHETFEKKIEKIYNLKSVTHIAIDNIKLDDKQLKRIS